jgi:hypothetical protein
MGRLILPAASSTRCAGTFVLVLPALHEAFSRSARPAARMLRAALVSRSRTVPHSPPVHSRTWRGLGPSFTPQAEQT